MNFIRYCIILGGGVIVLALIGGVAWYTGNLSTTISIKKGSIALSQTTPANNAINERLARNPLTGTLCAEGDARSFAVMLAADTAARPLYGIAQADIVVEMPALTNGITRYMAVFGCEHAEEIGSIRSARHDFLLFAKSFDAIYAHWGGSYLALDALKTKELDNIDALPNPYNAFYRKNDKQAPHNGFTSFARLSAAAQKLGYRMTGSAIEYPRIRDEAVLHTDQNIVLGYPFPYNVDFSYHYATNSYVRLRGGEKEMDVATNAQVEVKNVIVMRAVSRQVSPDYNDVEVEGEGSVIVYRNGEMKKGTWKREEGRYVFIAENGQAIGLVEGKTWISVIQTDQKVELTFK
ncbi:MAG: DUF3048 domain-containing protein [Candidatus Azambacteria bacterium]|nr:DUF3048 domain-containing protein [Candidatus Azambacteria bacterium]